MDTEQKLQALLGARLKTSEPLAAYTTFGIGGPAKYFATVETAKELSQLWEIAEKKFLPIFVLGGGSNILINDKGFDGLVIKLNLRRLKTQDNFLLAEAGVALSKVVGEAAAQGLSGLEWAVGIPGTIGGAVFGNAGAYGGAMSDAVESVSVLRRGKIKTLSTKNCVFGYRSSVFQTDDNKDIIVEAKLKLVPSQREQIQSRMKEVISQREAKNDPRPSVGSSFRNPELTPEDMAQFQAKFPDFPGQFSSLGKVPAAWLIEQCGLKGRKIGGAMVSDIHAGKIVNVGGATAEDVIMLVSIVKQKVRDSFGLQLMEEMRYVGF